MTKATDEQTGQMMDITASRMDFDEMRTLPNFPTSAIEKVTQQLMDSHLEADPGRIETTLFNCVGNSWASFSYHEDPEAPLDEAELVFSGTQVPKGYMEMILIDVGSPREDGAYQSMVITCRTERDKRRAIKTAVRTSRKQKCEVDDYVFSSCYHLLKDPRVSLQRLNAPQARAEVAKFYSILQGMILKQLGTGEGGAATLNWIIEGERKGLAFFVAVAFDGKSGCTVPFFPGMYLPKDLQDAGSNYSEKMAALSKTDRDTVH